MPKKRPLLVLCSELSLDGPYGGVEKNALKAIVSRVKCEDALLIGSAFRWPLRGSENAFYYWGPQGEIFNVTINGSQTHPSIHNVE